MNEGPTEDAHPEQGVALGYPAETGDVHALSWPFGNVGIDLDHATRRLALDDPAAQRRARARTLR